MTHVQLMGAGFGWFVCGAMHTVAMGVASALLRRRKHTTSADACFRVGVAAATLGLPGWFVFVAGCCWWLIDWAGGAK